MEIIHDDSKARGRVLAVERKKDRRLMYPWSLFKPVCALELANDDRSNLTQPVAAAWPQNIERSLHEHSVCKQHI